MTAALPRQGTRWILQITITAAQAGSRWNEQLDKLRPIAGYDKSTQTWTAHIGALDLAGLSVLQTLFDTARTYGTEVRLAPVPVPRSWKGPVFTSDPETGAGALLRAQGDEGRPLGHLPLA
ncbi:hypothetical protein [Streptomyces sp. NPDC088736]|uniref:hypothetical protein n=1 Tax=Streptomyces sp. NPDC088736 TaxID=3365881 RepID=UPI0038204102